jgi:hypothetical protein
MNCTPKIKNTCGEVSFATCVYYEGAIPSFSGLISEDCYTLEEVVADLYQITTDIKDEIDLSALAGNGITYTLDADNNIVVKNVVAKHAEEIVALKVSVAAIGNGFDGDTNITTWGLDLDCLVDSCGDPITTMKQLLQSIIDKACAV